MKHLIYLVESIKEGKDVIADLDLSHIKRLIEFENSENPFPFSDIDSLFDFFSSKIFTFQNVRKLSLRTNELTEIPKFVFSLTNLVELDLNRNSISKIPSEIENLESLKVFDISDNQIAILPKETLELRELRILRAYRNQLSSIPQKIYKLTQLRELSLFNNNIELIPESILRLDNLESLQIGDNPIKNVRSALYTQGNGIDALRIYFRSIRNGKSSYFYESKLIILGDGKVGKTTLMKNLEMICCTESHPSTKGLDVKDWNFYSKESNCEIKFHVWDFGGQGKYRSIQQLFCTPDAIYIYVTVPDSLKKNEKYGDNNYWLNFAKVLGDNSPIIFVTNKVDLAKDQNDTSVDRHRLRTSFPSINSFVKTRFNRTGASKESKRKLLEAIEVCIGLPGSEDSSRGVVNIQKLNDDWQSVIRHINKLKEEEDYISLEDFEMICNKKSIYDKEDIGVLLGYLDKSGNVLVYEKNKTESFDFQIILNPNWIRESVGDILNYLKIVERPWFDKNDLQDIWKNFTARRKYYLGITRLMIDLNFSFEINSKHYIHSFLPKYNSVDEDILSNYKGKFHFDCEFKPYIPAGILHKIIVNNISLINVNDDIFENKVDITWLEDSTDITIIENWECNQLRFIITGRALNIVSIIHHEVKKALSDFEGRNYTSEIDIEERIIWEYADGKKASISFDESINSITLDDLTSKESIVINKNVNFDIANSYGNISSPFKQISNIGLTKFMFNEFHNLFFDNLFSEKKLFVSNFWNLNGRYFLSTPNHYKNAILLKNNNWYQVLHNNSTKGLISAQFLLDKIEDKPEDIGLIGISKNLWPFIKMKWPSLHFNNHYVYQFPHQPLQSSFTFEALDVNDVSYLMKKQNYIHEYGGKDYLVHRIENGLTACLRDDKKLIAWIICHDDDSMGFLRVLKPYRGKGIATSLLAYFINEMIDSGRDAIGHISFFNKRSIAIAEKLNGKIIAQSSWVRERTNKELSEYKKGVF